MLTISACLSVHSYALQIEAERNRTGSALTNSFLYICMFQYWNLTAKIRETGNQSRPRSRDKANAELEK